MSTANYVYVGFMRIILNSVMTPMDPDWSESTLIDPNLLELTQIAWLTPDGLWMTPGMFLALFILT